MGLVKLYFLWIYWEGGGIRSKVVFMVQTPPKKDDIIYEQPLMTEVIVKQPLQHRSVKYYSIPCQYFFDFYQELTCYHDRVKIYSKIKFLELLTLCFYCYFQVFWLNNISKISFFLWFESNTNYSSTGWAFSQIGSI